MIRSWWSRWINRSNRSFRSRRGGERRRDRAPIFLEPLEDRTLPSGTWSTVAPMPTARGAMGVGVINNTLFAVGGFNRQGILNIVEAYDPTTNSWITRSPMPTAREGLGVGVINNTLYAVGGGNGPFTHLDTVEAYDPTTDTWSARTPMPIAVTHMGVGVINDMLYVVGGSTFSTAFSTVVEAYDPVTDSWTIKSSMPTGRGAQAVGVVGDTLFAVGGDTTSGVTNVIEAYDAASDTWTTEAPMPTARANLAGGVVNGTFYVVGGVSADGAAGIFLPTNEAYDPATNTWTTDTPMPTEREFLGVGVIGATLCALGGGNNNGPTATVEAFTPAGAARLGVSGFPMTTTAGQSQTFTVTAQDPSGNTASGYTGTVHFTSTDSKAVLPADYTFTAAEAGQHTFFATLKAAGTQTITATDTVKKTITGSESGIVVTPAAASHLLMSAPASSTAGTAFSITVTALDPFGNIATGYNGTLHFTSSDKKAALPSDYTFTVTDAGVHAFKVSLVTAGAQTITATDTVMPTFTSKKSIKDSPAALNHFKITSVTTTTAGTAFNITVTAQDAFNNTVTSYLGTIHFTSSDLQAVLPADYTFTATDKGVHTFTSGVILKTAGTQTVTATDTVTGAVTGHASITVKPGLAAMFSINAPSNVTQGAAFTFTVTALDAYGNVATGYTGTVHFTSSDPGASLPENFTFLSSDAGVETFVAIFNTTGTESLTATDTLNQTITGSDLNIQVS